MSELNEAMKSLQQTNKLFAKIIGLKQRQKDKAPDSAESTQCQTQINEWKAQREVILESIRGILSLSVQGRHDSMRPRRGRQESHVHPRTHDDLDDAPGRVGPMRRWQGRGGRLGRGGGWGPGWGPGDELGPSDELGTSGLSEAWGDEFGPSDEFGPDRFGPDDKFGPRDEFGPGDGLGPVGDWEYYERRAQHERRERWMRKRQERHRAVRRYKEAPVPRVLRRQCRCASRRTCRCETWV